MCICKIGGNQDDEFFIDELILYIDHFVDFESPLTKQWLIGS